MCLGFPDCQLIGFIGIPQLPPASLYGAACAVLSRVGAAGTSPTLQKRKQPREVKALVQSHTAGNGRIETLSPCFESLQGPHFARGSLVCTYCVQSLVHCLCSSGHSEVGYYHYLLFRMRKLRSQEGTRLAGVPEPRQTEPRAWEGAWWAGPLHSVLSPKVTLFAAGMSEDEAAQAHRPSLCEQDQQVRGCTSYGAGHGEWGRGVGQSLPGQLGTPPTSIFAWSTSLLGHFGPWRLASLHLLPTSQRAQ